MITHKADIPRFFEHLYRKYNTEEWIKTDPIVFPHTLPGNKEFIALTAALFAYGNVKAIQSFLGRFFEICGADPLTLKSGAALKYRFQNEKDINSYCEIMKKVYCEFGSVEALFKNNASDPYEATKGALEKMRTYTAEITPGLNFLLALPGKSASKRMMMFIRWMIRKDNVDFGLWKAFSPSDLHMPLDTHVKRLCTKLGVLDEKDSGRKALEKANLFFRALSPKDPVKYDFSLTRLGIACGCAYQRSQVCELCPESELCVFN